MSPGVLTILCECGLLIPIPNGNFGENAYYPNVDANQPRAPGPLDVAIRSTLTMFSPRLGMTLSSGKGKYWRWAGAITPDSLEALLLAVGEFAQHWQGTRLPDGSLPAPRFYPHRMDEKRMRTALEVFALLHSTGGAEQRPETKTIGGWPFDLSHEMPGLTQVYQERLSSHTSTAWTVSLDERNLGILLWNVGEYGVRANSSSGPDGSEYPPPTFDAPPEHTGPMRAALRVIAHIERGHAITIAQARFCLTRGL